LRAADLQRPAAVEQLRVSARRSACRSIRDPTKVAPHGQVQGGCGGRLPRRDAQAKQTGGVVILDTAGRFTSMMS